MLRYRFGIFELDTRTGELLRRGLRVRLHAQPAELLRLLVERPGEMVAREEIVRALWPAGTFVDFEHGVNSAVNRLRDALGDRARNPRFVETVARRGYRFLASVEELPEPRTRQEAAAGLAEGAARADAVPGDGAALPGLLEGNASGKEAGAADGPGLPAKAHGLRGDDAGLLVGAAGSAEDRLRAPDGLRAADGLRSPGGLPGLPADSPDIAGRNTLPGMRGGDAAADGGAQHAMAPGEAASPLVVPRWQRGVLAGPGDLPVASPGVVRALFLLLQGMYLAMYVGALANLAEVGELLGSAGAGPRTLEGVALLGALLIPVRLFLGCAELFRAPRFPVQFLRMWPFLLLADLVWALSPLLLLHHLPFGLALAGACVLVYSPFAQRSLVLMRSADAGALARAGTRS